MKTATELSRPGFSPTVPMPRMRATAELSLVADDTSSDGASWFNWRMSLPPELRSCSAETALTAIGTSDRTCERRVAVMIISPGLSSATARSAVVGLAGDGVDGVAASWANAAVGRTSAQAEASRKLFIVYPPRI